jgi:hypothetical protein
MNLVPEVGDRDVGYLPKPLFTMWQRRQIALITLGAVAVYCVLRWLPTGTNLSHMDFRVDAKNSIEFCDPLNPQFIPVVAVASPISMTVTNAPARAGEPVIATVTMKTASGKPIGLEDLLIVHTRPLHLLIVDPSLRDYQHVHPQPMGTGGEWKFEFTPRFGGVYRIFADFTPVATNRGLYANSEINVAGTAAAPEVVERMLSVVERNGYRFELKPAAPIRATDTVDLEFGVTAAAGGTVPMELIMDAFAHLVTFDAARSGFAHLHPTDDPSLKPDQRNPKLHFKVMIPAPGRYVIWAQINLAGRETFVPFWFDVAA